MTSISDKIRPTCGNCNFSYHREDDPRETERCKLTGRFNLVKVNPLAKQYDDFHNSPHMCAYHRPTERLKNRIDYSIEEKKEGEIDKER
jgi:hypothetical protein